MTETSDPFDALFFDPAHPRVQPADLRCSPPTDEEGYVVLVGVVHDHPASVFRAGHVVDVLQPDVLAVELPSLAIPLFESFPAASGGRQRLGGEMTAALRAAPGRTVGIDAPSLGYTARLFTYLLTERVSPRLVVGVLRDLAIASAQATWTLVAASAGRLLGRQFRAHTPVRHDVSPDSTPDEQARAERAHVAARRALLDAIAIPESIVVIDRLRETVMADRLRALRRDGDVVAVLGIEHLEPVYALLTA